MSRTTNPTLIGAFVLGAIALTIAGIVAFGSGRFLTRAPRYVLYFDGGVSGLRVGAPVTFRGVRIGDVTDIRMYFDPDKLKARIPVVIQIDPQKIEGDFPSRERAEESVRELVDRGLRAQLKLQSLVTGQLYVDFDFHPDRPARFAQAERPPSSRMDRDFMELPTIPSDLQELERTFQKLPLDAMASQAIRAFEGIEGFLTAAQTREAVIHLGETLENANALVTALRERLPPLADEVTAAAGEGRSLIDNADTAIRRLESQALAAIGNLDATLSNLRELSNTADGMAKRLDGDLGEIVESLQAAARSADRVLIQAEATLRAVEDIASREAPLGHQLHVTLEDLSAAARAFRTLSETLSRNPESLFRGRRSN
jgi:paraquat-inducible protein B